MPRICARAFLASSPLSLCLLSVAGMIVAILQMKELKLRESRQSAQDYMAGK